MAKKEPELNIPCPRCKKSTEMIVDIDLKIASNVTVLECHDDDCEHRFAKDQSVKLSSSLVLEAAECMLTLGGYSSLGEFVRECVRFRTAAVEHSNNALAFGNFMTMIADDPETWLPILKEVDEEVDE